MSQIIKPPSIRSLIVLFRLRDAREYVVTAEQFAEFIERHKTNNPVGEPNDQMKNSYILLDENLCFLDSSTDGKIPSKSILEVGVQEALKQSGFDANKFHARGGVYDWSRLDATNGGGCSESNPALEW